MIQLIQANLHFLAQAASLVDDLCDDKYARPEPSFYNSSVGGHLRHCLDHYEAFTEGMREGAVDYDARCREQQVEICTSTAHERILKISAALKEVAASNNPPAVQVKMDCGIREEQSDAQLWQTSTVGRELQFLVSHTVHHLAMIRGICERAGVELDKDFGMAPSTIKHREKEGANTASETID